MTNATPNRTQISLLSPFENLGLNRIFVPTTTKQFSSAVDEITTEKVVGFDTESKPVFTTGVFNHGPHIVQFATRTKAFIFQLHRLECRPFLLEVLQSKEILKVGFALKSDQGHLHNKLGVQLRAVLDLNTVFHADGYIREVGVKGAVAIVFNKKFHKSKKETTSNWALPQLTEKQLVYAANDAWAALMVHLALNRPYKDLPITGLTPLCENITPPRIAKRKGFNIGAGQNPPERHHLP
jgi:ribonuclease D